MSFLDRLVARSLGAPAALRPRQLTPFEAGTKTAPEPLESLEGEATFEAPPLGPVQPAPHLEHAPLEPRGASRLEPPGPQPWPAPALPPPALRLPVLPPPAPLPPAGPPPAAKAERGKEEGETPRPALLPRAHELRPLGEPTRPAPSPAAAGPVPEPAAGRREPARPAPPAPASPKAAQAAPSEGLRPLVRDLPRRLPAAPSAAPDIHIHIGRIEVRATHPEAPPRGARTPEAPGPSALERYLEDRARGIR